MAPQIVLSDEHLRSLLINIEDSFVERKPIGQRGNWLQATVAFANSTPIGYPAVLFIGVDDTGEIANGVETENVIKSFSDFIESRVWPPIYTLPRALVHGGKSCVAVIVPGSAERPHFTGKAYIRLGTQTKEASEQQFAELVAQRNSKARELLAWAGKQITPVQMKRYQGGYSGYHEEFPQEPAYIETCNAHFVTFRRKIAPDGDQLNSYPLNRIELGFDHKKERLMVYIYFDR